VNAIIKAIGGEYKADSTDAGDLSGSQLWFVGAFIFFILGLFTFMALILPGCSGWGLYAFLLPFYAAFPGIIIGYENWFIPLVIYAVVFPIVKLWMGKTSWGEKLIKASRASSGRSGWSSGGSSWGGGGGFSGGGGSFGGGGSSGGW
jgi:uncharacterized protein